MCDRLMKIRLKSLKTGLELGFFWKHLRVGVTPCSMSLRIDTAWPSSRPEAVITFMLKIPKCPCPVGALYHLTVWQAISFSLCAVNVYFPLQMLQGKTCWWPSSAFPPHSLASGRRNLWRFHRSMRLHCEAAFKECNRTAILDCPVALD